MVYSAFGRRMWLLLLFSAVFFSSAGAIELPPVTQVIRTVYPSGTPVTIGTPAAESEVEITPKTGSFTDYGVENRITLGVDWDYPKYFGAAFTTVVLLEIETFDAADVSTGVLYQELEVRYDPFSSAVIRDKQVYSFFDAYRFTVKITEINGLNTGTLPANLYIESRIQVYRDYDFASTVNTPLIFSAITLLDIDDDGTDDEISVSWNPQLAADYYHLEWTFVNDYSTTLGSPLPVSSLAFDFKHNSTRIETAGTTYRIPLLFDRGYVLFRVRAVGQSGNYIFSVWNAPDAGADASLVTSRIYVDDAHEADKNWQVTTTFAEEGKKKEVVSYFDGSLRSRQTVTRINTDENVIVGETVYDYQGRPAVTVLPAPVEPESLAVASLRYYPEFNVNASGDGYSRQDFDLGNANECGVEAGTMGTQNGASRYYSPDNAHQDAFQSYVPDAKLYPFTQVEYTPDNTGRIRRQGGVGEEFQLGSGHETKYYYGQPNQLQLDRLFGNEVGDAAHYKKNVVVDPNGQVSVSYLDQEGRVVATALAGDAAPGMEAIASESSAATALTVDLFARDAEGASRVNYPDTDSSALVFSTELLVPFAGNYVFDYEFTVAPFSDECLDEEICFSCVYELEIRITDECGVNYAEEDEEPVQRVVGQFTIDGNDQIVFSTECNGDYELSPAYEQTIFLSEGAYTVSKVLRIYEPAVAHYVALYLDPEYNSCALTLEDFEQEYLGALDYSGCAIDCEECLENLGTRDAFVAKGRGSAGEYEVLYAQCAQSCKVAESWCALTYRQLLADMRPGGQYAGYGYVNPEEISAGSDALSVLNISNQLPANSPSGNGYWRNPKTEYQGVVYPYYLNADGSRATVNVSPDGGNYLPQVLDVNQVFASADGNGWETYPENLYALLDFVTLFRDEWAAGLISYHPEYCYYETCRKYGEIQGDDNRSSDDFDARMQGAATWADAMAAGFIPPGYASLPNASDRVYDFFDDGGTHIYDPFVTSGSVFGQPFVDNFTWQYENYPPEGALVFHLTEMAAITARCPVMGGTLTPDCFDFGLDVVGNSPAENDALRDKEWNIFKSYYLSLKRQSQDSIADAYSRSSCYGLNHCIGNDKYDAFTSGMLTQSAPPTFLDQPYFSLRQPCGTHTRHLYANKQVRFVRGENLPGSSTSPQQQAYQVYMQTGLCPVAFTTLELMSELAAAGKLTAASEPLGGYAAYGGFYMATYNFAPPVPVTTYPLDWEATQPSADVLVVVFSNVVVGPVAASALDKTGLSINWSDIVAFTDFEFGAGANTIFPYKFKIKAKVVIGGVTSYQWIEGSSVGDASVCTFPEECTANDFSRDVELLLSALALNSDLQGTAISLEAPGNYADFVTPRIRNTLGTPHNALEWTYNTGTHTMRIYDANNTSQYIEFAILQTLPSGFNLANLSLARGFTAMRSNYQHYFRVEARDANGDVLVELGGSAVHYDGSTLTGLPMGECEMADPISCQGDPYKLANDFENVLRDRLVVSSFTADPDLAQSFYYSRRLEAYLGSVTDGTYTPDNTGPDYHERLDFDTDGCAFYLYTQTTTADIHLDAIVSVDAFMMDGEPEADNYYHRFKMVATFDTGSGMETDTIYGYSCLPLAQCMHCETAEAFGLPEDPSEIIPFAAIPALEEEELEMYVEQPWLRQNPCALVYEWYTEAVNQYNDYADLNSLPLITEIYGPEYFTVEGYCYCVEGYNLHLYAYIQGLYVPDDVEALLDIAQYCESRGVRPRCKPASNVLDGAVVMPSITYTDPCAQQLEENALLNAREAYSRYVEEQTTLIAAAYRRHCLGAVETFTAAYTDKEYHFTLYYYDQAGNLVRTVPPEGVRPLDITSPASDDALKVANDRYYGTQTVFTRHQLVTTYRYNSLNQLVQQSLPDHEKMNIWETSLASGLDPGMTITRVQFVDGQQGYLTGHITTGGKQRGLLYRTDDGGATWKRVNDLLGVTLHKVQMANTSIGYAVGEKGVLLKTENGGSSWDMLHTYQADIGWDLYDLYFENPTTGVLVGESNISVAVSGGISLSLGTPMPNSSFSSGGHFRVSSVTYDQGYSRYVAVARHKLSATAAERGRIYHSADGLSWTEQTAFTGNDLYALAYAGGDVYYTGGSGGAVALTDVGASQRSSLATDVNGTFTALYYLNADEGVGLIEEIPGQGRLYRTGNAGATWQLLGDAQTYYHDLVPYESGKLMAVGEEGTVDRVLLATGEPFGIVPLNRPGSDALYASWAGAVGARIPGLAGGDNGALYYNRDVQEAVPLWTPVSLSALGSDNALRGLAVRAVGSDPSSFALSGVLLTTQGNLYGLFKSTANVFSTAPITVSGAYFTALTYVEGEDYALAFDETSGDVYRITLPSGTAASSASALGSSGTGPYSVHRMQYRHTGSVPELLTVGAAGNVVRGELDDDTSPTGISWTDLSDKLAPLGFTAVEYEPINTTLYALADNGRYYVNSSGSWEEKALASRATMYTVKFNAAGTYAISGGEGGVLQRIELSTNTTQPLVWSGTATLYDLIAVGNAAVGVGSGGQSISIADFTTASPAVLVTSAGVGSDLRGVSFRPGSADVLVVGDQGRVLRAGTSGVLMRIHQVFTPALHSVHFTDAQHGYAVGDRLTVRYTADGGATWQALLPGTLTYSGVVPSLYGVYSHHGEGVFAGSRGLIYRTTGGGIPQVEENAGAGVTFYDVAFSRSGAGYAVGGNGTQARVYYTVDAGDNWNEVSAYSSIAGQLTALRMFPRKDAFIAVGEGGLVLYGDESGSLPAPGTVTNPGTSEDLQGIYFHDDLNGYIVGTGGTLLRSSGFTLDGNADYASGIWQAMDLDDGLAGQTVSADMDLRTIAFSERFKGFAGGQYDGSAAYQRRLHDESEIYSVRFWYDRLGRIVLSQNTKQYKVQRYSYTLYDALGRVYEAGEKEENASGALFASIFGTVVNNYYTPQVLDDTKLQAWIDEGSGARREVTRTWYDVVRYTDFADVFGFYTGHHRKRISTVTYEDLYDDDEETYDYATHYGYDIHGNVRYLVQDNLKLATAHVSLEEEQRYKLMLYNYDLISGNVHQVNYTSLTGGDGFAHRYKYDSDNRITEVQTSRDWVSWDRDAKYFYYAHGPLARVELGDLQVQGVDYVYTLQGWIKGVNSNTLEIARDPGNDSDPNGVNKHFAKDVYGYSLGYFAGDYAPINPGKTGTNSFYASTAGSDLEAARNNLYNGNIGSMVTTITNPSTRDILPQGTAYKYDQLNRLLESKAFTNLDVGDNEWQSGSSYTGRYHNLFSYDANGNILTQLRKDASGASIDELTYRYAKDLSGNVLQNRLYHVNDVVNPADYGDDIDDMGLFEDDLNLINSDNNYGYTEIGELKFDKQEEIAEIRWRVDGRVKEIIRDPLSTKKNLKFDYDPMGHRIAKHIYDTEDNWEKSVYYVRNAQGQVMAVYEYTSDEIEETESYKLKEQHIYGSSRLGMDTREIELIGYEYPTEMYRELGYKQYELSNHLGNVLAVVTDKKIPQDEDEDEEVDGYLVHILSSVDYSPFGVALDNRNFSSEEYRYGLQGWEKDDEISGVGNSYTTFFRQHNPRLGITWSRDPKSQYASPYIMLGNSPVNGLDPDGAWFWEKSNIRQARKLAKATGGEFEKWRGTDGKRYASVSFSQVKEHTGTSNIDGSEILDEQHFTSYVFKPGEDRSELLMKAGVGMYSAMRASATGFGSRLKWMFKSGDAWVYGWGEYSRGGQAPGVVKAIAGLNPLVSVPNALSVLTTDEDIYGVEASSTTDKVLAGAALIAPFSPGANTSKALLGKEAAGKVVDGVNTAVQASNDAGLLDPIKTQKSDSTKKE